MSKRIFVDEKTGERFEAEEVFCYGSDEIAYILKEIIEPKLEVGDWYVEYHDPQHPIFCRGDSIEYSSMEDGYIKEIRKANKEHWIKDKETNTWRRV